MKIQKAKSICSSTPPKWKQIKSQTTSNLKDSIEQNVNTVQADLRGQIQWQDTLDTTMDQSEDNTSHTKITSQPKLNLTNDQHRNSHDNIVAMTLLSDKLQWQKHRIRIIKIIVQLAKDQQGTKVLTRTKHD